MQTDQTIYLTDAATIAIERVPQKGLVRIKITGERGGGFADEVTLTVWGLRDPHTLDAKLPEITDTTSDEPPVKAMLAAIEQEEADI